MFGSLPPMSDQCRGLKEVRCSTLLGLDMFIAVAGGLKGSYFVMWYKEVLLPGLSIAARFMLSS